MIFFVFLSCLSFPFGDFDSLILILGDDWRSIYYNYLSAKQGHRPCLFKDQKSQTVWSEEDMRRAKELGDYMGHYLLQI